MNPVLKMLMRVAGGAAVWVYQRSNGRIGGKFRGTPVLLLTVPGRKTGTPHTTCVGFFEDHGGYLVAGSAAGAPRDPQWFRNLRAAGKARIQIGADTRDVTVRFLTAEERDRVWREIIVPTAPGFGAYEGKTSRVIPVAHLDPLTT